MKPVRTVEDIVRRKTVAKSNNTKDIFGNIKNAAKAVLKPSGSKIPFFIWFAIIIAEAGFVMKIAAEIIPRPAASVPQGAAMAQNIVESFYSTSTSNTTSSNMPTEIKPILSPVIQLPPFKPTSTATSTAVSNKKTAAQPKKPKPAPIPTAITARSLLDATVLSMSEQRNGPYKATFVTNAGTYGKITWDLGKTALTVSASMPNFSISYSCDPIPNMPAHDALDQSPAFNVKTSYNCVVNLTPASGNDRRTQSKQFSFTTGAGQLVVTPQSSMNTVLKDNASFGGFVFRNDDTEPITITGLYIDVSYRGLDTTDNPLTLRFKDPITELTLAEYNLENLAADQSLSYAHAGTNIHIPLSFTIGGANQKILPINIFGVHRLSIYGVDPIVSITLRQVTTNQSSNNIVLNSAKIAWSCIVPIGAYNPNATSGPYATGQACLQ